MAKTELWRFPPLAWALGSFGAFPVERGAGDGTAISRAASLLRDGEVLGMFPQGTSKRLASRPCLSATWSRSTRPSILRPSTSSTTP